MWKKIVVILFLFFLFSSREVLAVSDPTTVPNNHFGMHIVDTNDLSEVAKLVNSNGGDWGYVTLVIQKGERDTERWQKVFDEIRRLHLIPIVRIATAPMNGDTWEKPNGDEIDGWVSFLNSLNWVIKNRYVVVGNEPNHAKEWGGQVNPKEYADYLKIFSAKLKNSNEDFFIMLAGMDASATNSRDTLDEPTYLKQMLDEDGHVFDYIDGWASHSYPNPNFSGSGSGFGRGTVRTYLWELDYLKILGVNKNLPVFITETGWIHGNSLVTDIGQKIERAYSQAWNDKRVIAVTPFVFNYTTPPFDIFSWKNTDSQYYDFYYNVLGLPKIKGEPVQVDSGEILTGIFPKIILNRSGISGVLFTKNTGQAIWEKDNLSLSDNNLEVESVFPDLVEPNHSAAILVRGDLPQNVNNYDLKIVLLDNLISITNTFESNIIVISKIPVLSDVLGYLQTVLARRLGLK